MCRLFHNSSLYVVIGQAPHQEKLCSFYLRTLNLYQMKAMFFEEGGCNPCLS